ncbi:Rap-GAP domain-containing protein [Balamuthia mandrillaris]
MAEPPTRKERKHTLAASTTTKKLKDFFKQKKEPEKRFKCLVSWLDSATVPEQKLFYEEHGHAVLDLLVEKLERMRLSPKKEKKQFKGDALSLLKALHALLSHASSFIDGQTTLPSIEQILKATLHRDNEAKVRTRAFELLLFLIETQMPPSASFPSSASSKRWSLACNVDDYPGLAALVPYFRDAINLSPFSSSSTATTATEEQSTVHSLSSSHPNVPLAKHSSSSPIASSEVESKASASSKQAFRASISPHRPLSPETFSPPSSPSSTSSPSSASSWTVAVVSRRDRQRNRAMVSTTAATEEGNRGLAPMESEEGEDKEEEEEVENEEEEEEETELSSSGKAEVKTRKRGNSNTWSAATTKPPTKGSALFSSMENLPLPNDATTSGNNRAWEADALALCPATRPASIKDAVALFDLLFEYIEEHPITLELLLSFWTHHYFAVLYPKAALSLALISHIDEKKVNPFLEHCPAQLQECFLRWMAKWSNSQRDSSSNHEAEAMSRVLWERSYAVLIMEIIRQAFLLPLSHADTIEAALELVQHIVQKGSAFIGPSDLQTYWQQFVKHVPSVFLLKLPSSALLEQVSVYTQICKKVLSMFDTYSYDFAQRMEPSTWKKLQKSMLSCVSMMLTKAPSYSFHPSVASIIESLVEALFLVWIRSPHTTKNMWKRFSQTLSNPSTWSLMINQWKVKVVQLTKILISLHYHPYYHLHKKASEEDHPHQQPQPLPEVSVIESTTEKEAKEKDHTKNNSKDSEQSTSMKFKTMAKKFIHPTTAKPEKHRHRGNSPWSVNFKDANMILRPWTKESILSMWKNILAVIENPCNIQDPSSFAEGISGVSDVVQLLSEAEAKLPSSRRPPVPINTVFLAWVLEACGVEEKRNRGRLTAIATLCRLFCKSHVIPPPLSVLSHFYMTLQEALKSAHSSIKWAVFRNAANVFSLGLPGAAILIPDFLREFNRLWKLKTVPPDDVQKKSLVLLQSLICYPKHFASVPLNDMSPAEMHTTIGESFIRALQHDNITIANKELCLWGLGVFVFEDLFSSPSTKPYNSSLSQECLLAILAECTHKETSVAVTALSVLNLFTSFEHVQRLKFIEPTVHKIVQQLSQNIILLIKDKDQLREKVIVAHFQTMVDWVLVMGNSDTIALSPQLSSSVFRAFEWGFLGSDLSLTEPPKTEVTNAELQPEVDASRQEDAKQKHLPNRQLSCKTMHTLYEALRSNPYHQSPTIKEAAELSFLLLLNHYATYPSSPGCEITCSDPEYIWGRYKRKKATDELDKEREGVTYFVYNESRIFSLRKLSATHESDPNVRFCVRDATGKYIWDLRLSNAPLTQPRKSEAAVTSELDSCNKSNVSILNSRDLKNKVSRQGHDELKEEEEEADINEEQEEPRDVFTVASSGSEEPSALTLDPTLHLLQYLSEKQDEMLPLLPRHHFDKPMQANPAYSSDLFRIIQTMDAQQAQLELFDADKHPHQQEEQQQNKLPLKAESLSPEEQTMFHDCRLLLSHLGFLDPENRKRLTFLNMDDRLLRSIRQLDQVNGREVMKIGLIYVEEDQEDQYDILANEGSNESYASFVKGLGWDIDLTKHRGYVGGLSREGITNGPTAPYWSSPTLEVIFHDITRMPTSSSDHQQIHKKRHVGNDNVQIVWSENPKEYDPATITSQFNDAHIVIYPLPNSLYRVQVHTKTEALKFGPIQDGMVLNKAIMAPLVRATAVSANLAVRNAKIGELHSKKPFATRREQIEQLLQRHRADKSFPDYVVGLFTANEQLSCLPAASPEAAVGL